MAKKLVAERDAYNRTGISYFFYDGEKDKARQLKTAREIFLIGLDIANHKYFEENSFSLNDKEKVRQLVGKEEDMKFPQFKNPEAFLLAYWCLTNDKKFNIDFKRLESNELKLKDDDRKVSDTDILRYARMIYNLKKK